MSLITMDCPVCKKKTQILTAILQGSILPGDVENGKVHLHICRICGTVVIPSAIKEVK